MERIVEREVSMKILSFGSLNIDYVYKVSHFVKKGETLSAEELNVYTGGKGLNQSIDFHVQEWKHIMQERLAWMDYFCWIN